MKNRIKNDIGMALFVFIFIYIIVNVFSYFFTARTQVSEVLPGTFIKSDSFTGFIMRNESLEVVDKGGYINYFVNDGEKVVKNSDICIFQSVEDENQPMEYTFDNSDYNHIKEHISSFAKTYQDSDYDDVYDLHYKINNVISQAISRNHIDAIKDKTGYNTKTASQSGIISYTYDNVENYTQDNITPELFSVNQYEKSQISAGMWVEQNSPAYKMIYDDQWDIIIYPTEEQLQKFRTVTNVDLVLSKEDIHTTAAVETFQSNGYNFVKLTLDNYMIRYYTERYIDIEVVWSNYTGLKIPSSALTTKKYYQIPIQFLSQDDNGNYIGFYTSVDGERRLIQNNEWTVYSTDEEYCYISCDGDNQSRAGTIIQDPKDSTVVFSVGQLGDVNGVYEINKGYAIFRVADILYQDNDYCIIKDNTKYGVTPYDRIMLDSSKATEDRMVY